MTRNLTLSPEQRDLFLADGAVRVPGAIPEEAVEAMVAGRRWRASSARSGIGPKPGSRTARRN